MRVSDIESELPNSFENLSYSNNSLESEICSLREAYEKRLFSFADDGGKWISVNEVQKQTDEEYWKELKQYPVPDMFQVITWRANELIDNLDNSPKNHTADQFKAYQISNNGMSLLHIREENLPVLLSRKGMTVLEVSSDYSDQAMQEKCAAILSQVNYPT